MKITAGLGSIDDYEAYVQAGADELFCGYVPHELAEKWPAFPLNRREVMYYNVQIGSESEMRILRKMTEVYQVPVAITLNSLSYHPQQYEELAAYIRHCLELGFNTFILADPALMIYLQAEGLTKEIRIHVSGEVGEINAPVISQCRDWGAERIIFHRKTGLQNMRRCIERTAALGGNQPDYEAFILNEMCHFHGGFCQSMHCDELSHICHLPYYVTGRKMVPADRNDEALDGDGITGESGCGLCALPYLKQIGVQWVKVVGRGNYSDRMVQDIAAVKRARELSEACLDPGEYIKTMKQELFPEGCSGNCYYREAKSVI